MVERCGWSIDLLVQRQQLLQRGGIDRHPHQRLPPGVAALSRGLRIMLARHPAQQLVQRARQCKPIAVVPMLLCEPIEFAEHLVRRGITSISVTPDSWEAVRATVLATEWRMLLESTGARAAASHSPDASRRA